MSPVGLGSQPRGSLALSKAAPEAQGFPGVGMTCVCCPGAVPCLWSRNSVLLSMDLSHSSVWSLSSQFNGILLLCRSDISLSCWLLCQQELTFFFFFYGSGTPQCSIPKLSTSCIYPAHRMRDSMYQGHELDRKPQLSQISGGILGSQLAAEGWVQCLGMFAGDLQPALLPGCAFLQGITGIISFRFSQRGFGLFISDWQRHPRIQERLGW